MSETTEPMVTPEEAAVAIAPHAGIPVVYPTGRQIVYPIGVGLHDLSFMVAGNGFNAASVTAHAGGGQALATPLAAAMNLIAICATLNDSVGLPPAMGGQVMWLVNGGALGAQVFGAVGRTDTINGIAGATGIALAAGKSITLFSPLAGAWFGVLSA
jgi:hypothetical protein